MNLTICQEVDSMKLSEIAKGMDNQKAFLCTSNICLLPCDALFLRC